MGLKRKTAIFHNFFFLNNLIPLLMNIHTPKIITAEAGSILSLPNCIFLISPVANIYIPNIMRIMLIKAFTVLFWKFLLIFPIPQG